MQSSTTVIFRAVVMLVCVVAIPAAALFGTALPEVAGKLILGNRSPADDPIPNSRGLGDAPIFAHLSQAATHDGQATGTAASRQEDGLYVAHSRPLTAMGIPSGGTQPNTTGAVDLAGFQLPQSLLAGPAEGRPGATIPADYEEPTDVASPPRPPRERFTHVEQRLRQLGATYYLLELWGSQGQLYRFYCRMAIGGNPNCTRYFEATDADALAAMGKVLDEVEAWQRGAG